MPARAIVRSRWAVSVIFFINGVILASWVPHIPAVKQHLRIGDGELGLVLLSMAAGAVCALSAAGWFVRRFGSRAMTTTAAIGLCLVLPLPVLSPSVPLVALSLLLLGAWNGTLDVSMNAQAVVVERRYARPIMSSFHGLFSVGGLVGAGVRRAGDLARRVAGPARRRYNDRRADARRCGAAVPAARKTPVGAVQGRPSLGRPADCASSACWLSPRC